MSTPSSLPAALLPCTPSPPISPSPSQFLLSFASPSEAAKHNTTLKLKGLLESPELAANIRAELCPNGFLLGDLFHIVSWSQAGRMWKGLGYGAKEPTLYKLVRLLAPACSLPDSSELTRNEISTWVKGVQREQKQHFTAVDRNRRLTRCGSVADANSAEIYLRLAQMQGAQLLSFKGPGQAKLDLQQGKNTSTPPPRRLIADVVAAASMPSPPIRPALAALTNSSPPPPPALTDIDLLWETPALSAFDFGLRLCELRSPPSPPSPPPAASPPAASPPASSPPAASPPAASPPAAYTPPTADSENLNPQRREVEELRAKILKLERKIKYAATLTLTPTHRRRELQTTETDSPKHAGCGPSAAAWRVSFCRWPWHAGSDPVPAAARASARARIRP